jgi:hypothetical protein
MYNTLMSLTRTAYTSRLLIKYGSVGIVLFAVLWSGVIAGIKAYKKAHPPYQPPTVRYGVLPKIVFPEKTFDKKSFVMEFPNDSAPGFGDQARVYVVFRPETRFLALEIDTQTARSLGFDGNPAEVSPGIYRFRNDNLNKTLTMNVLESSFKMEYPYLSDQLLLSNKRYLSTEDAIREANNFLRSGGKLTADLDEGNKQTKLFKIEMGSMKEVSSISEANAVKVDFYRKSFEGGEPILTANYNSASVSVLVSGSDTAGKRIIEADYKYVPIDRESYSTYPIKTAAQAIDDLKRGNYWPVKDIESNNATIRRMYLAYFEPITLTNYMQPIFVFEGDGGFVAYVPAIVDKYIQTD